MGKARLAVALIVLLLVTGAFAAPKPKPTRTPTPTPTPTVTATPTATPTANCAPITISTGGTYSGCYESTNPAIPAVAITTSSPVTLNRATIRHRGRGIIESPNAGVPVNLTVVDSTFTALGPMFPDAATSQRAIDLDVPAAVVVEHNRFVDGGGIWVGTSGGPNMTTLRVRYNESVNIGRYQPDTCTGGECIQFFQAHAEIVAGEVSWNKITNHYGQSRVEDNISLYKSGGVDDANRFVIKNNLVDGQYPQSWAGESFGTCAVIGDAGGQYSTLGPKNYCINTTGVGLSISGGIHQRLIDNVSVSDNKTDTGVTAMSSGAQAVTNWCNPSGCGAGAPEDNDATGNVIGLERMDGTRWDIWCPASDTDSDSVCSNNTHYSPSDITSVDEQAQRNAWAADVAVAGLTIGPRPV